LGGRRLCRSGQRELPAGAHQPLPQCRHGRHGPWCECRRHLVVVNDGNTAAAGVSKVTLNFNQPFAFPAAAAATLVRRAAGATPTAAIPLTGTASADSWSYSFTFSGGNTTAGALNDGLYQFAIPATLRPGWNLPLGTLDVPTNLILVSGPTAAPADSITLVAGAATGLWSANGPAASLSITANALSALQINSPERLDSLALAGGFATIAAGGANTLLVKSLSIATSGKLDLSNNSMVLDYSSTTPANTIRQYLASARNGGAWNGPTGIFASTSTAAGKAIGYLEANDLGVSTFVGQPTDATSLLVKPTVYGDADLNGRIDGTDYSLLDRGMLMNRTGWVNGDFNYDNLIDSVDKSLLNASAAQPAPAPVLTAAVAPPVPVAQIEDPAPVLTTPAPIPTTTHKPVHKPKITPKAKPKAKAKPAHRELQHRIIPLHNNKSVVQRQ
jgi:hypothetical protein